MLTVVGVPVMYPALVPVLVSDNPVPVRDGLISYVSIPAPPVADTGLNGVTARSTAHVFVAISKLATIGWASLTVILNEAVAVAFSLSVTVTVYVVFTLTDGVPEINPPLTPLAVIDNPDGKLGLIVYDEYTPLPPLTLTLANSSIVRFLVNDQESFVGVTTNTGFTTLKVNVCIVACPARSVASIT